MKLPLELVFKKGQVFLMHLFGKDKYLILLNLSKNETVVIMPTTSHVEDYKTKYKHKEHMIINDGELDCIKGDSVLDFQNVQVISYEKFSQKYNDDGDFVAYAGCMPQNILDEIDAHIKRSRFITAKQKRIILGE